MSHTSYFGLALAWISPILLGFIVAFVLSRMRDNEAGNTPARKERLDGGADHLHHA